VPGRDLETAALGSPAASTPSPSRQASNPRADLPPAHLLSQVEAAVLRAQAPYADGLRSLSPHVLASRGRRVHPSILLLAAECAGGAGAGALSLAAVVELLHSGSLVHDSVLDSGYNRDGRVKAENQASIILGDCLLASAFTLLAADRNLRFAPELTRALTLMCQGQTRLLSARDHPLDPAGYLAALELRAGSLTSFSAGAGLLAAGGPPHWVEPLREFGRRFGLAFHLAGDLLDLLEAPSDPSVAARAFAPDRGPSLPLALVYHAGPTHRRALEAITRKDDLLPDDLLALRHLAEETGAISHCRKTIDTWLNASLGHLAALPQSPARDLLARTAADLCHRPPRGMADRTAPPPS
jgi:geranylgeranyl pyrophosphate synthase